MRPSAFSYAKPKTLEQAMALIRSGATVLAGGQSLLQALRLRADQPTSIVDINHITELSSDIKHTAETINIGALVTHRTLAEHPIINLEFPWLAKAAAELGDIQIRNRGTVLGNVCWSDPRANLAVALLATNAVIVVSEDNGARNYSRVAITDFFTGFRRNVLGPRLALSIELQRGMQAIGSYLEFSRQRQDLALCNVCVVHSGIGTAVAVGGIDQRPLRLAALEDQLNDPNIATGELEERIKGNLRRLSLAPMPDHYGSRAYKQHLAATLIKRALDRCLTGGDRGR